MSATTTTRSTAISTDRLTAISTRSTDCSTIPPGSAARDAQKTTTKRLSNASELASVLGVSRRWVYDHADALGAIKMGSGSKPRLRFDPDEALRRLQALSAPAPAQVVSSPAPRRCAGSGRPRLSEILADRGGHRGV